MNRKELDVLVKDINEALKKIKDAKVPVVFTQDTDHLMVIGKVKDNTIVVELNMDRPVAQVRTAVAYDEDYEGNLDHDEFELIEEY